MMGVIGIPFAFPNISTTCAVFDGPFGKKFAADIEKKTRLKVLGFGDEDVRMMQAFLDAITAAEKND